MEDSMLTTKDNPYSPFDQWDEWYAYDFAKGYHTPSLLGRVAIVSHELSSTDQDVAIEQAIDEIVAENVTGLYVKVTKHSG